LNARCTNRVEWIAATNQHRIRLLLLISAAHSAEILAFVEQKIVAAHTRLAGDPRGNHDDVAILGVGVVSGAHQPGIKAHDRRGLHQIEGLAAGMPSVCGMFEQDDIAQFAGRTPNAPS